MRSREFREQVVKANEKWTTDTFSRIVVAQVTAVRGSNKYNIKIGSNLIKGVPGISGLTVGNLVSAVCHSGKVRRYSIVAKEGSIAYQVSIVRI